MQSFDPSVIGQIGEQPDIGGAIAKGFTLKDLINQNTLGSMQVKQAQREQEQSEFLSGLSKEFDISNPQQASKAASKAAQAGYPDLATGVLKQSQTLQLGQAQVDEARFQAGMQAQTYIDEGVQNILATVRAQTSGPDGKPLLTPQGTEKYDSRTKDAMTMAAVLKMKSDLQNDPTLSDSARQVALKEVNKYLASGKPITYDGINQVAQGTKTGREMFDKELERRKTISGIQHQQVEEAQAQERIGIDKQKLDLQKQGFGDPDSPESQLLGALAERGVSLPAGLRSKQQQQATVHSLIARNPGLSVDEIADKVKSGQLSFGAEKKETTTAAGIAGRVSVGENELIDFAPKALAISDKVPRGNFVPFNKLRQMGEANISDPDLKELYGRTNAILNAYDVVAARGGTDKDKRAENRKNLETADSPAAYRRAVETMLDEAKTAKGAARTAEGRTDIPATVVHWDDLK